MSRTRQRREENAVRGEPSRMLRRIIATVAGKPRRGGDDGGTVEEYKP
jgi:hypothetical protein